MHRPFVENLMVQLRSGTAIVSAFSLLFGQSSAAYALPVGGQVSAGQGTIATTGGYITVTQSSQRVAIDWNSFNIGGGEAVRFNQPSSSAIALNRIHDASASQIDGALSANGQVWLINPNGIMFGKGAQVNVGGLLATTSDIDNDKFMAGHYAFTHPGNPAATIANAGLITVSKAGLAAFVAPNVTNSGLIAARLGKVQLGSGDTFALDLYGDGLINLSASPAITSQFIGNSGMIQADGGMVLLTAAAAGSVVNSLINMSGVIQANSVGAQNGTVILYAEGSNAVPDNIAADKGVKTGNSEVLVSGAISAQGKNAGETGGLIKVLGDWLGITSGATLNASGAAGGGTIKVGGDFHGEGTTPTARRVVVEGATNLYTNDTDSGNGGKVAVWSDESTSFSGNIEAKGGPNGGNGGFVETSGHVLTADGSVNASAPHGNAGTWLLDPNDITISSGANTNNTGDPDFTSTNDNSVVNVTSIQNDLNAGTNVTVTTASAGGNTQSGDITVSNAITKSAGGDASLTLSAYRNITLNANITSTSNKLDVVLDSNTGGAGGYINVNGNITSNGGSIWMGGGALDGSGHPTGYAIGNSSSGTQYGINLSHGKILNAGGGNIVLRGQGGNYASGTNYGIYLAGNQTIRTSGTGTITLTGTAAASTDVTGGDIGIYALSCDILTSGTGAISLTGTGGGAGGTGNNGVYLSSGPFGAGNAAPVTITGTAGFGTVFGIINGSDLISAGGTVTLISPNSISLGTITYAAGTSFDLVVDANTSGSGGYISQSAGGNVVETNGGDIYFGGGALDGSGHPTSAAVGLSSNTNQYGIYIGDTVDAGGGNITMYGQGGAYTSGNNWGIVINYFTSAIQTSGSGNITLTGVGGGAGAGNRNYGIKNSGTIATSGNGTIGVTATGGSTGTNNYGIYLVTSGGGPASISSTGNGPINVTGIYGAGSSNYGIATDNSGDSIGGASYSGDITLRADTVNFGTATSIQTSGDIAVKEYTAGTTIGTGTGTGTLSLTDTYLGYFTFGSGQTFTIGDSNSGNIDIKSGNALLNTGNVTYVSGGNITIDQTVSKTAGGDATLDLEAAKDIIVNSGFSITSSANKLNTVFDADTALGGGAIVMSSGSSIVANGGDIVMGGQGIPSTMGAVGDAARPVGINLNAATLNAGGGDVSLIGTGFAGTTNAYGIEMQSTAKIMTTGSGTITLNGTGGNGTTGNAGVLMTGTNTQSISAVDGAITITGTGQGSGGSNYGIFVNGGATSPIIKTTGAGTITLTGSMAGTSNAGINATATAAADFIQSGGDVLLKSNRDIGLTRTRITYTGASSPNVTLDADMNGVNRGAIMLSGGANITTNGGNIILGGGADPLTTAAYGSSSIVYGIQVSGSQLNAGGGDISLMGTGYSSGSSRHGIQLQNSSVLQTSGSGVISLTGRGGSGGNSTGINVSSARLDSLGGGDITLIGYAAGTSQSISVSNFNADFIHANGGTVTLKGTTDISLANGSIDSPNSSALNLIMNADSDANGDGAINITGSSTQIITNGGDIVLGGGLDPLTGYATAVHNYNDGISITSAQLDAGGGDITMHGAGLVSAGGSNQDGVIVSGANATVETSGNGDITIVGLAGKNTNFNYAFSIAGAGAGIYTQNGDINITANGNPNSHELFSQPINQSGGTIGATGSGDVHITSTAMADTIADYYTDTSAGNQIGTATMTGNIYLNVNSTMWRGLNIVTNGSLIVTPRTNGTGIGMYSSPNNIVNDGVTYVSGTANLNIGRFQNDWNHSGTVTLNAANIILGNANTGNINITTAGTGVTGNITAISGGVFSTTGLTDMGGHSLTAQAAGGITLDSIQNASSILATTNGDITLGGALSASSAGTAITLVDHGRFINNAGAAALSAPGGRWLVYSVNPANDTLDGLSASFHRYSCAYGGSCPAFPANGNGLLYSYTPMLTVTGGNLHMGLGDRVPILLAAISGYVNGDTSTVLSGMASLSTNATSFSPGGSYAISTGIGTLSNSLGYGFNIVDGTMTIDNPVLPPTIDASFVTLGSSNTSDGRKGERHLYVTVPLLRLYGYSGAERHHWWDGVISAPGYEAPLHSTAHPQH